MTTETHRAGERHKGTGRDYGAAGHGEDDFLSLRDVMRPGRPGRKRGR